MGRDGMPSYLVSLASLVGIFTPGTITVNDPVGAIFTFDIIVIVVISFIMVVTFDGIAIDGIVLNALGVG